MKIPADAKIPFEKISNYLLVAREWDDKAKLLARVGFTQENPEALLGAIRELAGGAEAVEDRTDEYGIILRAEGELKGPNGRSLPVVTIWIRLHADGLVRFVTLKPRKERRS
jgi:hypothetical protein